MSIEFHCGFELKLIKTTRTHRATVDTLRLADLNFVAFVLNGLFFIHMFFRVSNFFYLSIYFEMICLLFFRSIDKYMFSLRCQARLYQL